MLLLVFDTPEESNKFLVIYNTYGETIYYTIKRFIDDEYLIEDISQEIFIRLARHLDKINLNNAKQAQNYIITATRNYCKNYIRNNTKVVEDSLDLLPPLHTEYDEVLDKIIHNEDISSIAQAVSELDDIYKSVLELKYINEFNNDEISSFLNLRKKTVVTRLYRANIMLRDKLREHFYDK